MRILPATGVTLDEQQQSVEQSVNYLQEIVAEPFVFPNANTTFGVATGKGGA
jgi:hypothetical protein